MKKIFFGAVFVAALGMLAFRFWDAQTASLLPCAGQKDQGIFIIEQGNEHLGLGDPHPSYNSIPPTSGWHTEMTAKWGVQEAYVPNEMQVHNLEHGGILIQYKPDLEKETVTKIQKLTHKYPKKVISAPYPGIDRNIALTAWTYLDKFDAFDECRIIAFINAHINQGPEMIDD